MELANQATAAMCLCRLAFPLGRMHPAAVFRLQPVPLYLNLVVALVVLCLFLRELAAPSVELPPLESCIALDALRHSDEAQLQRIAHALALDGWVRLKFGAAGAAAAAAAAGGGTAAAAASASADSSDEDEADGSSSSSSSWRRSSPYARLYDEGRRAWHGNCMVECASPAGVPRSDKVC